MAMASQRELSGVASGREVTFIDDPESISAESHASRSEISELWGDESELIDGGYEKTPRQAFKDFYGRLSGTQKKHFIQVSEEVPLDRTAGLGNIARDLLIPSTKLPTKILPFYAYARVILNLMYMWYNHPWYSPDSALFHHQASGSSVELHSNYLKVCERSFNVSDMGGDNTNSTWDTVCFYSQNFYRLRAMLAVEWFELSVVTVLTVVMVYSGVRFLCCGTVGCCGGRHAKTLPERCPVAFFLLPNFTAKFSLLMGLQLVNVSRMKSFLVRGELKLMTVLVRESLSGAFSPNRRTDRGTSMVVTFDNVDDASESDHGEESQDLKDNRMVSGSVSTSDWICVRLEMGVGFACQLVLIVVAFQALLVKLTTVHFLTVRTWDDWYFSEIILAAGFVNQLAGAIDVDWVEVHRVLLLKFGGTDSTWQSRECKICASYFELLAKRIVYSEVTEGFFGRWRALGVMSSFGSSELQKMLLSPTLETHQKYFDVPRLRFYDHVLGRNHHGGVDEHHHDAIKEICSYYPAKHHHDLKLFFELEKHRLEWSVDPRSEFSTERARPSVYGTLAEADDLEVPGI